MAESEEQQNKKLEQLTHTKKFEDLVASDDLYAIPVTAVPGCGFMMSSLLKKEKIERASDLYDCFKGKSRKDFSKFLACKLGNWNVIYSDTIIRAFEDWEKAHEEKKPEKEEEEKKKGPPRKVGPGSKKWECFLQKPDLSKTTVRAVPGIASMLGCEMANRGYDTAGKLMEQYKGTQKTQCNRDEEKFHKWILCCFGYWNAQYSKVVIQALKAYDEGHDGPAPLIQAKEEEPEAAENAAEDDAPEAAENAAEDDAPEAAENAAEDDAAENRAEDDAPEAADNAGEDDTPEAAENAAEDDATVEPKQEPAEEGDQANENSVPGSKNSFDDEDDDEEGPTVDDLFIVSA